MINKSMWLGTSERMLWVPCPAIDMPRPQERWQASGTFANGGGWVRRSAAGHRVYDLSWNLMPASEISKIRAIFDGVYGQGPFYFIDPSAERTNVFPAAWAQPRLALDGGPPLVYDQVPSREVYPGPNSTYPQVGARYVLDSDSIANTLKIPVPEGYRFHFRAGYENPYFNQVESARQALLDALAAYTDAPVQWSTTEPGDTSVVWVDPATGEAREWTEARERLENLSENPQGIDARNWSSNHTARYPIEWDPEKWAIKSTVIDDSGLVILSVYGSGLPNGGQGIPASPGVTYYASAEYLTLIACEGLIRIGFRVDGSWSTNVNPGSALNVGEWSTVSHSAVAPPGTTEVRLFLGVRPLEGNAPVGTESWVRRSYFSTSPGPYGDGDTPGWQWDGEPHASTSHRPAREAGWWPIEDEGVVAAGGAYADAVAVAEGSTELCYRHNGGDWTPMRSIQHSVTGPGWVEFQLRGTGTINLHWMQGQILSAHEPAPSFNDFHPGQGNSGVDFEDFMEHTHSVGNDLYGASVRLREVQSWL